MNKIRVAAISDPPYTSNCFDLLNNVGPNSSSANPCPRPGLEIEFLQIVLEGLLHLSVDWIKVNTYTESYDYVKSGKADMVGTSLPYSLGYGEGRIITPVVMYSDLAIFGKEIDTSDVETDSLLGAKTSFLKAFQWPIWMAVIGVTVLTIFLARLSGKLTKFVSIFWFVVLNIFLSVLSNLMAIGMIIPSEHRALPFDTMDQLGEMLISGKCKIAVVDLYSHYIIPSIFSPSHNLSWAKLFRKVNETNPPIALPLEEFENFILAGNKSQCHAGINYMAFKTTHEQKHCRIKTLHGSYQLDHVPFAFMHTVELLKEPLNILLSIDSVKQLYKLLSRKYLAPFVGQKQCDYEENIVEWTPLVLEKVFSTIFIILSTGFCAAALVFSADSILKHLIHKVTRNETTSSPPMAEEQLLILASKLKLESDRLEKRSILTEIHACISQMQQQV